MHIVTHLKVFSGLLKTKWNEVRSMTDNKCPNDGTPLKWHDGALGYEALYCPKCGYWTDFNGEGQDDCYIGR